MSDLAGAWKHKAKTYRLILRNNRRDREEWQSALRLAGVGRMMDLNPDHTRLTVTVPSKRLVDKMLAEARAALLSEIRQRWDDYEPTLYPAATPSGERTEWQDGWNKGVMAVSDVVDAILDELAKEK